MDRGIVFIFSVHLTCKIWIWLRCVQIVYNIDELIWEVGRNWVQFHIKCLLGKRPGFAAMQCVKCSWTMEGQESEGETLTWIQRAAWAYPNGLFSPSRFSSCFPLSSRSPCDITTPLTVPFLKAFCVMVGLLLYKKSVQSTFRYTKLVGRVIWIQAMVCIVLN